MRTKKKATAILILCMLLPTLAILLSLLFLSSDSLTEGQVSSLTVGAPQSTLEFTDSDTISFYVAVINSGSEISAPAKPESEYTAVSLDFEKLTKTLSYTLLLTTSEQDCIYKDASGKFYRIKPDTAKGLLLREELGFVYKYSEFPAVSVTFKGNELLLKGKTVSWSYLLADGSFRSSEDTDRFEAAPNLISSFSELKIEGAVKEDSRYITIFDGDEMIFSGNPDSLSSFEYNKDSLLVMNVETVYYSKSGCEYYGKSTVSYDINYDLPASCELITSHTSLSVGGVAALYLKNTDHTPYTASADFITSKEPTFYKYKDGYVVLFPISLENKAGTYTLSLQNGEEAFSFSITIKDGDPDTVNIITDLTPDGYDELQRYGLFEISKHLKTSNGDPLFKGIFTVPSLISDTWIHTNYGAYLKIGSTVLSSQSSSIVFVQHEKSDVTASNDGNVVFTGEIDFYGNTVIVDHGYGIKTVYCNLLDISVTTGQKIYKNQVVGRLGESGEASFPKTTCFVFVNEIPVNPYSFINNSFLTK